MMQKRNLIAEFLINLIPLNKRKFIRLYYVYLHLITMMLGLIIVLFSKNIFHLLIILIILCLDALANILLHDCPLTILENKYSKISISKLKSRVYKKLGINYKCTHIYENQLELIINTISATTIKIFIIILCDIFNIKISN
jgi:hypothetical protein